MRTALFLIAALTACTNYASDATEPDTQESTAYPCNIQHETCAAAEDVAEVVCARRIACDPKYTVTHDQCVAGVMYGLCAQSSCSTSPYDREQVDACINDKAWLTCDLPTPSCHL